MSFGLWLRVVSLSIKPYLLFFLTLFGLFILEKTGDGWYIGATYVDGEWRMVDGSPMWYTNFPKYHVQTESIEMQSLDTPNVQRITNYAAIFYDVSTHGYETYNWGYMSPRDRSKLGSICELTLC